MHFRAEKDIPSYIDLVDDRLKSLSDKIADQLEEQRLQQELMEAQQRAAEEAERERLRMVKLERKTGLTPPGGINHVRGHGGGNFSDLWTPPPTSHCPIHATYQ